MKDKFVNEITAAAAVLILSACIILTFGCGDPTAPAGDDTAGNNPDEVKTYSVTYHANGATGGSVPVDSTEY